MSKYIVVSLMLSMALHLMFIFMLASFGVLPTVASYGPESAELVPIDIALLPPQEELERQEPEEAKRDGEGMKEAGKLLDRGFADPAIAEIFDRNKLTAPLPKPTVSFAGLRTDDIKPDIPAPKAEVLATAPRPKIIEIDAAKLPANSSPSRKTIAKVERIDVSEIKLPSLLPHGPSVTGQGASYNVKMMFNPGTLPGPGQIDGIGTDGGNGLPGPGVQPGLMPGGFSSGLPKIDGGSGGIVSFEEFVDVDVVVMDDSLTGGGFFKATIKANEKCDAVREISKDVIIIIDRSSSISPKKFAAFREAASNSLEYLNARDRFNVVTFTDKPLAFAPECIPANPQNISAARKFISRLARGGTTSVFDGIMPFVNSSKSGSNGRPMNIFMLTDGISTVNIFNDDDFLRSVTRMNPGNVSIFSFCAGKDANRDLLDFMGFLNRGQSFHSSSIDNVSDNLIGFIANHSSLLIRDIEYMADESLVNEIYPRKLQHLYRGSDVEILGHYGAGDTELILRIIGYDSNGIRRDVMFRRAVSECRQATAEIDKEWAAKKIMNLLATKAIAISPDEIARCEAEIRRLKARFDLAVPY